MEVIHFLLSTNKIALWSFAPTLARPLARVGLHCRALRKYNPAMFILKKYDRVAHGVASEAQCTKSEVIRQRFLLNFLLTCHAKCE